MKKKTVTLTIPAIVLLISGCSGMGATRFVHPDYNFAYVERVAVIPFENLTDDQAAGARATRFFVSELLATEAFEVVEPGEVTRALEKIGTLRTAELTQAQLVSIAKELMVQALILGSVGESSAGRSGSASTSTVTLVVRMVEADTGATVWSATHTEGGRNFWSALLGTGERSKSEVTRRCVVKTIATLIH